MSDTAHFKFPLFPLSTVLFPGGLLPLRIFEPRYLRMVADCLKRERGFIVCHITAGREVGTAANFTPVGTVAKIVDYSEQGGMLHITCEGEQRVQILGSSIENDQLITGEAVYLEREPKTGIAEQDAPLVTLVEQFFNRYEVAVEAEKMADASWIGFRLAEMLPLPHSRKQWLLELTNPTLRLNALAEDLQKLRDSGKLPPELH